MRVPVDATFATNPGVPAPGFDLFRFSYGHGGLACEACHGSTHAVFPSSHLNDNVQNLTLQGHEGTLAECASCHNGSPQTVSGGPHGLHPLGAAWVQAHADAAEGNTAACRACHGSDYRGSVLSYATADRTLSTEFGSKHFWRGFRVGCYACHNGPSSDSPSPNHPAQVPDRAISTPAGAPAILTLTGSDADGNPLAFRIVHQPDHGTVGLAGAVATYRPEAGTFGPDAFTYAAWDGNTDSNLGTVSVNVEVGPCPPGGNCIFADGFASGDLSAWSAAVP